METQYYFADSEKKLGIKGKRRWPERLLVIA